MNRLNISQHMEYSPCIKCSNKLEISGGNIQNYNTQI